MYGLVAFMYGLVAFFSLQIDDVLRYLHTFVNMAIQMSNFP